MKIFYLSLFFIVFPQFIFAQTFFINERGCVVCQDAQPGDTGVIDGVTYTAVDRAMLDEKIINGEDLTKVCVSLVTDMSGLFKGNTSFKQAIINWDVSNVANMSEMFRTNESFNQPIGNWDVSKVSNMSGMFAGAITFKQDLGNWDVSKVTDMSQMFQSTWEFNQSIENWDVSNVTTMKMMFYGTNLFNQPLGNWDVSKVTNMSFMFGETYSFNQPIENWDVSNVTDMSQMFYVASSFNQPIGNWDVSGVRNLQSMFSEASSFNQDLSTWCVSGIQTEPSMFSSNSPLLAEYKPKWGITCTNNQIAIESSRIIPFDNPDFYWKTNELASHYQVRLYHKNDTVPFLDTTITQNELNLMFLLDENQTYQFTIRGIQAEPLVSGKWIKPIEFNRINKSIQPFLLNERGCVTCEGALAGDGYVIDKELYIAVDKEMLLEKIESDYDLTKLCVSLVTDMSGLFKEQISFNQPISNWDVSKVTDMSEMFYLSQKFNQSIENWDVNSVTNMSNMFNGAVSFNQTLEKWDVSNVTNMSFMFSNLCPFNQAIENWNVSNVTNLSGMFYYNSNFNNSIDTWNVSNVTDISNMFNGSYSFNQSLENWDVNNAINMEMMFSWAESFNQPLGNWDVSKVANMNQMFNGASSFNQDISKWCVSEITFSPEDFAVDSPLQQNYLPKWGTCPENPISIESIQFSNSTNSSISWKANDLASHYQVRLHRKDETSPFLDSTVTESILTLQTPLEQKEFYQFSIRGIQEEPFLRGRWVGPIEFQGDSTTVSNEEEFILPTEFQLAQNFPNPFNPSTQIRYSLPKSSLVKIEVFSSLGQRIAVLVNEQKPAGEHTFQFNAQNLASGVYLYRIITPEFSQTRLMNLVK